MAQPLISENSDDVMVWDVATREHKRTFENVGGSIVLSPDGKTLASEDYKGIHLWDARNREAKKKTIAAHLNYRSNMLFSFRWANPCKCVFEWINSTMGYEDWKTQEKTHRTYEGRFTVCRSARMEKRSQVAVEIGPSDYGM